MLQNQCWLDFYCIKDSHLSNLFVCSILVLLMNLALLLFTLSVRKKIVLDPNFYETFPF